MKKSLLFLLVLMLILPVMSLPAMAAGQVDEPAITLEEKENGYGIYYPLGVKYQLPQIFEDSKFAKRRHVGFESTDKELIRFSRQYWFRTEAMTQLNNDIRQSGLSSDAISKRMEEEVTAKDRPIFAFFVLNVANIPEDEALLKEELGFDELTTLSEADGLRQVFAKGARHDGELTETEKADYNAMFDALPQLEATIQYFKPMKAEESIGAVENWTFNALALDQQNFVNQDFLKNGKLTFVTYWATWCPHCLIEMRTLAWFRELYGRENGVQVLAVTADLMQENYDPEVLAKAQNLIAERNADVTAVFDNMELENGIFKYAMNFPTSFFVDPSGNVLKVYVGEPGLEELLEDTSALLKEMEEKQAAESVTEMQPAIQETVPMPVVPETPVIQETWPEPVETQAVIATTHEPIYINWGTPVVTNEFGMPYDPSKDFDCNCGN